MVLFQGQSAIDGDGGPQHPLFREGKVKAKSGPAGSGLLNVPKTGRQIIKVPPLDPAETPKRYGEETFKAVSEAYSRLQSGTGLAQAHYGPYALVLHNEPYADTFAPLKTTLIMPADRINPLVAEGFYGTGTLPAVGDGKDRKTTGILVSIGGNTMDLVVGKDATVVFLQEDPEGRFRFRVYERFALRLKDTTAVMRLVFE